MIKTTTLQPIKTDTWVQASWGDFVEAIANYPFQDSRTYYDQGYMRLEMAPLGAAHGQDNSIISSVVILYGVVKNLSINEYINTSFRKTGMHECQPDLAYYIGSSIPTLPRTNTAIDVDKLGPPTLVVEIGASSFSDDLGAKRLLYEQLGIEEYWVVNTEARAVIAFAIANNRSGRIETSAVLPNLKMVLVEEALQRSVDQTGTAIAQWLLEQYAQL